MVPTIERKPTARQHEVKGGSDIFSSKVSQPIWRLVAPAHFARLAPFHPRQDSFVSRAVRDTTRTSADLAGFFCAVPLQL